jgi:hypothetical protein
MQLKTAAGSWHVCKAATGTRAAIPCLGVITFAHDAEGI